MKFDMHCHTKEGSIDSSIGVLDFARGLKEKGFQGMMVTDHDTYKGYGIWEAQKNNEENKDLKDFVILKGLEYDTKDAGHFLVIMPDDVHLKILQVRGLPVKTLIKLVHHYGGILGPAHPFGVKSSSMMFFKKIKNHPQLLKKMDFIEGFNACESKESNILAKAMGIEFNIPMIAGSDSHTREYLGMAYTNIDYDIKCNNDLIEYIKETSTIDFGGTEREICRKGKMKMSLPAILAFRAYNSGLGYLFSPYRKYITRGLVALNG